MMRHAAAAASDGGGGYYYTVRQATEHVDFSTAHSPWTTSMLRNSLPLAATEAPSRAAAALKRKNPVAKEAPAKKRARKTPPHPAAAAAANDQQQQRRKEDTSSSQLMEDMAACLRQSSQGKMNAIQFGASCLEGYIDIGGGSGSKEELDPAERFVLFAYCAQNAAESAAFLPLQSICVELRCAGSSATALHDSAYEWLIYEISLPDALVFASSELPGFPSQQGRRFVMCHRESLKSHIYSKLPADASQQHKDHHVEEGGAKYYTVARRSGGKLVTFVPIADLTDEVEAMFF